MLERCPYKDYPVLFVDDEQLARMTFERLFKRDFTLYMAQDGEEALDVVKAHPEIAILISDQRMPRMNGLELLTQISRERPEIISILVTAYTDISLLTDAVNKGNIHRYLTKPYDDRILKREIMQGIERYHLIKERDRFYLEQIALIKKAEKMQRLASMGTLLAGMAHDINNSLVAVNTFLMLIPEKQTTKEPDTEFWNTFYSVALTETKQIQKMTNDLLNYSISAKTEGLNRFEFCETDMNTLLRETLLLMGNTAQKKGLSVVCDFDPDLPTCRIDSGKIRQVFVNLLLNAIQATQQGSIRITTSHQKGDPSSIHIVIEDTGTGISPEHIDQLFEPFFTTKEEGTGLGLMMCREIVKKHGGSIQVRSSLGKGTTMTVSLPLHFA